MRIKKGDNVQILSGNDKGKTGEVLEVMPKEDKIIVTGINNAFNQMLERGYNENVVIVYLYKYMGHKTITETEYYLHFTDYNKNKLIESNDAFSKSLYEGVDLNNE